MTQLSAQDLFTPAASGVGTNPNLPPAAGTWMAILLQVATTVGLPTTSWQSGGPELTILQAVAVNFAETDANISIMAQGGFLDWAASGTVTFTNTNGITTTQPVTPDPSIPSQNPTGEPGWLDVLGQFVYGVTRLQASFATNTLAIVNTTVGPLGPYAPGTYHVANAVTGATYHNRDSLTIASGQVPGTGGQILLMSGTSTVTVATVSPHGLATGAAVYLFGFLGISLSSNFAQIVVTSPTSFQLAGVTGTGVYIAGGIVYTCVTPVMVADTQGPAGTSAPGAITTTVTTNTGVSCSNLATFVGNAWESNLAYAARCRLKLASLSPNGAAGAYEFVALTAQQLLAEEVPSITLDGGAITKVLVTANPQTGIVTVTVANANPASTTLGQPVVEGATNLPVAGAANSGTGLVRLQVGSTTGLQTNDWATVSGIIGTVEANGTWQIIVVDASHVDLIGSAFANAYVSGGILEGGDLGQVDNLLQSTCTPDDTIKLTVSATAFPVTINATVVVAASFAATYAVLAAQQIAAYITGIPIGGTVIPPASTGVVEFSAVEGTLFAAGIVAGNSTSYVKAVQVLTLNGASVDLAFPAGTANATLAAFNLTLVQV